MTLTARGFRLVLVVTLALIKMTLRWGLEVLGTTVVMQGLVVTLLLTPATWEITLVVLAIATTGDNQSTRGTPYDNTSNSTR
eukprot:776398-Pyramimonas_sp.AAC.1